MCAKAQQMARTRQPCCQQRPHNAQPHALPSQQQATTPGRTCSTLLAFLAEVSM